MKHNAHAILKDIEAAYTEAGICPLDRTTDRVIQYREWCCTHDELRPVIEVSGVRWLPRQIEPGPAFAFPIYDLLGFRSMVQFRLCEPEDPNQRYRIVGNRTEHLGPLWFGCDRPTVSRIVHTRSVLIVEGPFDVLACRVILGPNVPTVCPLGKNLTWAHVEDLHLLGVNHLLSMWDLDPAGMAARLPMVGDAKLDKLICPASDPSDALQSMTTAQDLYRTVQAAFPLDISKHWLSSEEFDQWLASCSGAEETPNALPK